MNFQFVKNKGLLCKVDGFALSVSHSLDSSPKVGAFGSPCKIYHYAKASPLGRGGFAKQRRRGRAR